MLFTVLLCKEYLAQNGYRKLPRRANQKLRKNVKINFSSQGTKT